MKRSNAHLKRADKDYLEFIPLGSGQEVGRSCHILKFKGKTIMLDCGIHPAYTGIAALPFIDEIEPSEIDILLISHFHLDHVASLPYFLANTDFKGRVFMTNPTKSIYKLILQDYLKVSILSTDRTLFTEQELLDSMDRIEGINYHQVFHHNGIKFWCYPAGHVLGAAMFMVEIAGIKILYTGDYSRREDRHLYAAETPEVKPDILIVEATYGIQILPPIEEREERFTSLVKSVVEKHGNCLIPVFALGRAQELLLILDEFWESNDNLKHNVPIYYASALATQCMNVYRTYVNMMNSKIQAQSQFGNPFDFKHIQKWQKNFNFQELGPCVVMASPGMLQNGLSRDLFEQWCSDRRNGLIIPGYCAEGTLAKDLERSPEFVTTRQGLRVQLRMSVNYVTFSAHADFGETSEFVELLQPSFVILVHGAENEMSRLKRELERKYNDGSIRIYAPKNCQAVEIEFRAQKIAKVVGGLASITPSDSQILSGLMVRKDYQYQLMATEDLSRYTTLASTIVRQSMVVPFNLSFDCLRHFVGQMYDVVVADELLAKKVQETKTEMELKQQAKRDLEEYEMKERERLGLDTADLEASNTSKSISKKSVVDGGWVIPEVPHIFVHDSVMISKTSKKAVTLEWQSNPVNDMVADSLIALLMTVQSTPGAAKFLGVSKCSHKHVHYEEGKGNVVGHHEEHEDEKPSVLNHKHPSRTICSDDDLEEVQWFLSQHVGADIEVVEVPVKGLKKKGMSTNAPMENPIRVKAEVTVEETSSSNDDKHQERTLSSSSSSADHVTSEDIVPHEKALSFKLPLFDDCLITIRTSDWSVESENKQAKERIQRILTRVLSVLFPLIPSIKDKEQGEKEDADAPDEKDQDAIHVKTASQVSQADVDDYKMWDSK